jgi:hypothetical protein
VALTSAFAENPKKQLQWTAFSRDLSEAPSLGTVVADLEKFLMPHLLQAKSRQAN